MYNYEDADIAAVAAIYFVMIIFLGPFFLLNLILAVILSSFTSI